MKLDDYLIINGKEGLQKRINTAMPIAEYLKNIKRLKSEALKSARKKDQPTTREEIIDLFKKDDAQVIIHPAQDFYDGVMYYAVRNGDGTYLINSKREIFALVKAKDQGLSLKYQSVDTSNFSNQGIVNFLERNYSINPFVLYQKISDYIGRFYAFNDPLYRSYISLWVMGTYVFMIFRYYPYVWLNAEKNSGKTLLMEMLSPIAFNGAIITSPTPSVIFRQISNNLITMFIDEVENLGKYDKELQGLIITILNAGFNKSGSVQRTERGVNGDFVVKTYSCYSPKMFAGIASISDVLADRAIRLPLLRKRDDETVERYCETKEIISLQKAIRDDLYVFGCLYASKILALHHDLGEEFWSQFKHLKNRELDIWEPIIILANLIDGNQEDGQLVNQMKMLSEKIGVDKHEENLQQNDTYKILKILKIMLSDATSIVVKKEGIKIFSADKVLLYFQKTEEFSWVQQTNFLTSRFKKLGIRSDQMRVKSTDKKGNLTDKKIRVYLVNEISIKDLFERYKI